MRTNAADALDKKRFSVVVGIASDCCNEAVVMDATGPPRFNDGEVMKIGGKPVTAMVCLGCGCYLLPKEAHQASEDQRPSTKPLGGSNEAVYAE